ncbi:MAG TPA: DUF5668 domain-containing protein [Candidatus Limnocylindria bacterium]|nr:DUF5668 domain-containing protein [Candidatus Limnocylindria bacterium]
MHVNRGFLFWGVALLTAGAIALAATQGIIDPSVLSGAWRLWPVILIAIGLSVLLSRTPFAWIGTLAAALVVGIAGGALVAVGPGFADCSAEPNSTDTATGQFAATAAEVDLELTCGALRLTMGEGTGWTLESRSAGDSGPNIQADAGSLSVDSEVSGLPFDRDQQDWSVALGNGVTYDLEATLNAGESSLDISDGRFSSLQVTTNAGTTNLTANGAAMDEVDVQLNAGTLNLVADDAADISGSLGANAGTMNLCVPDEAGLQITVESSVAFSHNLDDRGLAESDDTFTSPNFASAAHHIVLRLQGNAATFNLNPEEGC